MVVDAHALAKEQAPVVVRQLSEAARLSRNEADFRAKAGDIFQRFADSAGVTLRRHDEYAVASGRADTVYNRLVIEYKIPGKLTAGHSRTNDEAIAQAIRYIRDIATKEHQQVSRMAGIVLDGKRAIFIRFYEKSHVVDPPVELTPEVVERLLKYLASLAAGVALVPENLLRDFAVDSPATRVTVRALYDAISKAPRDSLSDHLFLQWQIFFQEISGYQAGSAEFGAKPELRSFVARLGLSPVRVDPSKLLFSVHTYFALIIKLIAWLALSKHLTKIGTSFSHLATLSGEHLRDELAKLEHGGLFRELGMRNLLEGDFFGWYLDAWDNSIREGAKLVLERLADYDPGTLELNPEATRDLLKKLYQYLMPREMRHDLGEYYTPDWLAELVLNRLEGIQKFSGDPNLRILDPACGSGTFLVMAIKAVRETARREMLNERETLQKILLNIVGLDLNPLAVIASRTNYLLAIQDLLDYRTSEIDIPVYLADSIIIPARTAEIAAFGNYRIRTAVGVFEISSHLATRDRVDSLANLLDDAVASGISSAAFLERAERELGLSAEEFKGAKDTLFQTFQRIDELHRSGLDGLWARIIKNAFAPLFIGDFDYVVGNPPWVNWEHLPEEYREQMVPLYQDQYLLFPHKGLRARHGSAKVDISTLMTYVALDRFLRKGGKLGFVITQSVFKTDAGKGFRRFEISRPGTTSIPVRILHVDDFTELKPFEGATNRPAVMVVEKGRLSRYPVPYSVWRKTEKNKSVSFDSSLGDVESVTRVERLVAVPIDSGDLTSVWLTVPPELVDTARKMLGPTEYKAHAGVFTGGANAVYWLEATAHQPTGLVAIRNMTEGAKKKVEPTEVVIEAEFLFPLLRGRDVEPWACEPSAWILVPQDPADRKHAYSVKEMQVRYPKTYAYLATMKKFLEARPAYRKYLQSEPWYALYDVKDYTFTKWKVVWREQARQLTAAVLGLKNGKQVIPDHKLMFVPFASEQEAHFLCSLLNSSPVRFLVRSFAIATQIDSEMLAKLGIPKWNASNPIHQELSKASRKLHEVKQEKDSRQVTDVESHIDKEASRLWRISYPELQDIWRVLRTNP